MILRSARAARNWSVFLERPNTGRHEKAPVRCPCSRLAALHGAPRTRVSACGGVGASSSNNQLLTDVMQKTVSGELEHRIRESCLELHYLTLLLFGFLLGRWAEMVMIVLLHLVLRRNQADIL